MFSVLGNVRTTGFQPPYHPLQIATWALLVFLLGGFYGLVIPVADSPLIFATVPYFILHCVAIYCAIRVSVVDPVDPNFSAKPEYEAHVEATSRFHPMCGGRIAAVPEDLPQLGFCYACKVRRSKKTAHCKICKKCVYGFDHHCMWLNNCVGAANYKYFLGVLASTLAFVLLQLSVTIVLLCRYFVPSYYGSFRAHLDDVVAIPKEAYAALLIFYIALMIPLCVSMGQLFHFHLVLISMKKTTYQYWQDINKKQRAKQRAARQQSSDDGGTGTSGDSRDSRSVNNSNRNVSTADPSTISMELVSQQREDGRGEAKGLGEPDEEPDDEEAGGGGESQDSGGSEEQEKKKEVDGEEDTRDPEGVSEVDVNTQDGDGEPTPPSSEVTTTQISEEAEV